MNALLLTAALAASTPAPAYSSLPTEAAAALREERITHKDYEKLAAGDIVTQQRETPKDKTGVHVAAFAIIRGTQEQVFDIVADCKRQPEFMPNFKACEMVTPDQPLPPNERWNENRLEFGFFPLKFKVAIVQHAKLYPPHKLSWARVRGDIKVSEGYWRVVPLAAGVNLLVYDTLSDPGGVVPTSIQRSLIEHTLPATVAAVRKRMETLHGIR